MKKSRDTLRSTVGMSKKRKAVDFDKEEEDESEEETNEADVESGGEDEEGEDEEDNASTKNEEGEEEGEEGDEGSSNDEEDPRPPKKKARRADSEEDADSDDSEDSDAGHDRTAIHEGDDNIRALLSQFNHDQQNRYEYYRRAAFQRTNIKKVMQTVANSAVSQTMSIVMGGITKVFVGELIETARTVMDEWKENGPIKPRHLREAYRRMRSVGLVPYAPHRGRRALRHYR
eukprot:TRINITY_DN5289_c0_g1_i1.p1 TRINITY_DN5289_c0_g1~~TRINITY_DN5289_c0_g1_i1.p1  ORF type:complete len:231 (-),score=65.49 TRINITY_DN5289_c0_g1_i1:24-716(-)